AQRLHVPDVSKAPGCGIERFLPRGFPEHRTPIVGIDGEVFALRRLRFPDQRSREPMPVLNVVEAVPALDAQAARVRRAILPLYEENFVLLDVISELAAHTAVRAYRIHLLLGHERSH